MNEQTRHYRSLAYADPRVFHLEAVRRSGDGHEPSWKVTYWPRDDDDFRPVVATLHAASQDGWVSATVGAIMVETGTVDREVYDGRFAELLADSDALDALYFHARQHAATLAAMSNMNVPIPDEVIAPEIGEASPETENSVDDAEANAADHSHAG